VFVNQFCTEEATAYTSGWPRNYRGLTIYNTREKTDYGYTEHTEGFKTFWKIFHSF